MLPPTGYTSGPSTASPPSRSQGASIPAVPCPLTSPARRLHSPPGRQNMISSSQHSFPLSGVVAFAGSRHGSPFSVAPVVSAILSVGGSVRVGCASGVDAAVRLLLSLGCGAPGFIVLRAAACPPRRPAPARWSPVLLPCACFLQRAAPWVTAPRWRSGVLCPPDFRPGCAGCRPSVSASWSPLRLAGVPGFVCLPAPSLF